MAPGISERLPPVDLALVLKLSAGPQTPLHLREGEVVSNLLGQWDLEPRTGQTRWPPLARVEKSFSVSTPFEPCVSTVLSFQVPPFYLTWISA